MKPKNITVLGVGNILFADEGVGIRVIERLQERYDFPENVSIIDGGTLGLRLLGVISEADYLIVVDAVKNKKEPGSLYRLEGEEVPKRILAKNSLHQVDFLETLAACQVLDKVPETVILGVEPQDIETPSIELTPTIQAKVDTLIQMVLKELDRLGVSYHSKGEMKHVFSHPG
ncbi:MAG: HyaD/HybD family hydrogenase maturation endopeptidase [Deltaproteobacteria bacterium]|nr:MAG: HyaD/HybD family hydrogenase maturation endopeptidase [Deltaproteobacteria bacterium]